MVRNTLLCLLITAISGGASAFMPAHQQAARSVTAVNMAPKFDMATEKWIPTNDDESTPAYGPIGKFFLSYHISLVLLVE